MTEREIDGIFYRCEKLPAEQGLELFLRVSAAFSDAQGLFEAIALDSGDADLIRQFFAFARGMDPKVIHPLIMDLSRLPKRADGAAASDLDLEGLVQLAFFAIGVNFGSFLPVGLGVLFNGPGAEAAAGAGSVSTTEN
jgi:hypothetical protein